MLRTRAQNELCHKYLLLKLMPLVAIYKKAVQREHSVDTEKLLPFPNTQNIKIHKKLTKLVS